MAFPETKKIHNNLWIVTNVKTEISNYTRTSKLDDLNYRHCKLIENICSGHRDKMHKYNNYYPQNIFFNSCKIYFWPVNGEDNFVGKLVIFY